VGSFQLIVKDILFCCTGWGGAGNCGTSMKSKIMPIAQWLSWRVLWLMGYDYDTISNELLNVVPENEYDNDNYYYDSDSDEASTSSENNNIVEDSDNCIFI